MRQPRNLDVVVVNKAKSKTEFGHVYKPLPAACPPTYAALPTMAATAQRLASQTAAEVMN